MFRVGREKKSMFQKKNQRCAIALILLGGSTSANAVAWAEQPEQKRSTTPNQWSVPEAASTPNPHSKLGLRSSERNWTEGQDRFIGPVLQLLPPQVTEVTPPVSQSVTPPAQQSGPRMVTRQDAQILGFRKSWELPVTPASPPSVVQSPATLSSPMVAPPNGLLVLQPPAPRAESTAAQVLPNDLPPGLISKPAISASTRTRIEPQPLRDPAPVVSGPSISAPAAIVGSGVRVTTPAKTSQLSQSTANHSDTSTTSDVADEVELQRLAREVATILESRIAAPPNAKPETRSVTRPAHPAENNEPTDEIRSAKSPKHETQLEEVELSGPITKPATAPERTAARDSFESELKSSNAMNNPYVERVPLQTLEGNSEPQDSSPNEVVDRSDLTPFEIEDDVSIEELDASNQPSSPKLRLANLDATGRPKSHDGRTAVQSLDPAIARMQRPIQQCLQSYHGKRENADSRSNWGMMHAIMIYGSETRMIARGRDYSTVAWMAGNNVCRGQRLMSVNQGKITALEGVGLQGHQAQWLAIMSLIGVPSEYPLYVGRTRFTVADLVQTEAAACEAGKELTFTLIGLSHYLDTDTSWRGVGSEPWDFPRLIANELDQPVVGAACGGTHRLMSFAHALRKRRLEGRPVDNQWIRAEMYLDDFVDYTYKLQNRDGSFSTAWFEASEDNGDLDRKIQTTGHMTEFLLTHLSDDRIVEPQVVRAVQFILSSMLNNRTKDWEVGPKGHALRALAMYYERAYGEGPAVQTIQTAARTQRRR